MPEGPFGGPRPFASNRKTVIVLVGIDGPEPPPHILTDMQTLVEDRMNRSLGLRLGTLNVSLTTRAHPTREEIEAMGDQTILHLQQYDVETPWKEISREQINNVRQEVVSQLRDTGANVVATRVTVV